jgi:hypothetical protein
LAADAWDICPPIYNNFMNAHEIKEEAAKKEILVFMAMREREREE